MIEKRLRIEMSAIKEAIVKEAVWVSTENQLADVLTKNGTSPLRLLSALKKESCSKLKLNSVNCYVNKL